MHNTLAMLHGHPERVAVLWELAWTDGCVLTCSVHRAPAGFEMRVESNGALVMANRCDLQPRAIARAQALRVSLLRRGWREQPGDSPS
jgi:hypothetical protein